MDSGNSYSNAAGNGQLEGALQAGSGTAPEGLLEQSVNRAIAAVFRKLEYNEAVRAALGSPESLLELWEGYRFTPADQRPSQEFFRQYGVDTYEHRLFLHYLFAAGEQTLRDAAERSPRELKNIATLVCKSHSNAAGADQVRGLLGQGRDTLGKQAGLRRKYSIVPACRRARRVKETP